MDVLNLDLIRVIVWHAPSAIPTMRLVCTTTRDALTWTPGLVRCVARQGLVHKYATRHVRRRHRCACADCKGVAVDTVVWLWPRAVCHSLPYCCVHAPVPGAAALYAVAEGQYDLWW